MGKTNVVVMLVRGEKSSRWMLRRTGSPVGSGWARFDGSFTPGSNPYAEAANEYVVSSPLRDEIIEFARELGWNVVSEAYEPTYA